MKLLLMAALILTATLAQGRSLTPLLLGKTGVVEIYHYGSGDHRRYGRALVFTLMTRLKNGADFVAVTQSRYLVACDGSWATNAFSRALDWEVLDGDRRDVSGLEAPSRGDLRLPLFGDGLLWLDSVAREPIKRNLSDWCSKASSKRNDEISVFATSTTSGVMLMRTFAKRGRYAEAWVNEVGTKQQVARDVSGRLIRDSDGAHRIEAVVDAERSSTKRLYSVDCQLRLIDVLSVVGYAPDGSVVSSKDLKERDYTPAAPDSVGESVLDMLCRL